MTSNEAQIDYWSGPAGQKWADLADTIEQTLAPTVPMLVSAIAPRSGETILDIGCGAGALSVALAAEVEPGGRIYSLDVSPPLLAVAERRFTACPTPPHIIHADAQTCAWKRSYDAAVSRFGVMFFDDPVAAFANIARALRPQGRLLFQCWRPPAENEWVRRILPVIRAVAPDLPPVDPHAPGPFALADHERTADILQQAGFDSIRMTPADFAMRLGDGVDALAQAVEFYLKIGPLAAALASGDRDAAKARQLLSDALAPLAGRDAVAFEAATWLVSARRP